MNEAGFPTILALGNEDGLAAVVEELRMDGYLVLLAATFDDAVHVIRIHSREIHVLVTQGCANLSEIAAMVTPFRLGVLPVVRLMGQPDAQRALREVRSLVRPPEPAN
jgi:hypothetical protein